MFTSSGQPLGDADCADLCPGMTYLEANPATQAAIACHHRRNNSSSSPDQSGIKPEPDSRAPTPLNERFLPLDFASAAVTREDVL